MHLSESGSDFLESPDLRSHLEFMAARVVALVNMKERLTMTNSALIRPAWTPATIGLMVLGFVVFWPLGLAMLAYILWGDRLDGFKRDVNRATDDMARQFRGCGRHARHAHGRTGNVAFDDWREAELERLDEERRKLDEMRNEFDEYVRELRRAKDQEDFDRFMRDREASKATKSKRKSVPDVKSLDDEA